VTGPTAHHWVVEGRVQGVGFRWFVLRSAERLGVAGWVRNREDGAVEVVGSAAPGVLDALEEALRRGPPGAFVQHITRSDVPHQDVDANSFKIKH